MMPAARVTEADVLWVMGRSLDIDGDVVGHPKQNAVWSEATMTVRSARENGSLQIRLTYNFLTPDELSISILYREVRIRALDLSGSHRNEHTDTNRWIKQTHEHVWTDRCHGSWAVTPNPPSAAGFAITFRDFCARHGIRFNGRWNDPPRQFQLGLLEES